jgi:hypothetical protein
MSGRTQALTLYRRILRAHKTRLPDHLRKLGDAYVREEFKRHKKADAKWLVNFYREWNDYVAMVEQQKVVDGNLGAELSPDHVAAMSDEQKAQLNSLKVAATNAWKSS